MKKKQREDRELTTFINNNTKSLSIKQTEINDQWSNNIL